MSSGEPRGHKIPALPFPRGVLTEQEAISRHLRYLAAQVGPRPVGSAELARAHDYILDTVKLLGFSPEVQAFPMSVPVYPRCGLRASNGRLIPCLPVMGSPPTSGALRSIPRLVSRDGQGDYPVAGESSGILEVSPVRAGREEHAVAAATRRGAGAVLLYREQVPEIYSAMIADSVVPVPCVTIRRADAWQLGQEPQEVELLVETELAEVLGVNIMVEIGRGGRTLLFLANHDTRPGTPGAYLNASGVAALLELLTRLRGWRGHRILVGFLDGEEMGAVGSRHCRDVLQATGLFKDLRGVVYVSGLGLRGVSILPATRAAGRTLADRAMQLAAEEGMLASMPSPPGAGEPRRAGIWSCRVIGLAGPPLAVQHTALDQPDLLKPRFVSRAVSVLDRLARTS